MDNFFEQNVAGERGPGEQIKYALCWVGIVLFAVIALFGATSFMTFNAEGGASVNWGSVIALVGGAAAAVLIFLQKDKVYVEYDYTLWNNEFEVCAVYNRARRKKLATIQLNRVTAWGPAGALAARMHNAQKRNWCSHEDAAWCLLYSEDDGAKAALLELSEEMCAQLRTSSRAMRSAEVKP